MDHKELWKSSKIPSSDSKSNFIFSNALIADTYIQINNIATIFLLVLHILISLSLFATKWWLGLLVFIVGMFFIILASAISSIIAEIYRHLKEINHKTKHPDID